MTDLTITREATGFRVTSSITLFVKPNLPETIYVQKDGIDTIDRFSRSELELFLDRTKR
jgi:hypothetical protein